VNNQPSSQIKIYLLRLWQDAPHHPWQITLKQSALEKQIVFKDLEDLMAFLQKQIEDESSSEV
jgi:hypothetical protein